MADEHDRSVVPPSSAPPIVAPAPRQLFPDPIPGIIPFATLTIFAGAPGVGKTTIWLDWMRRWRDGEPICGHVTNPPTSWYYVCADRGQTSDEFYQMLGFTEDVTFYSVVSGDSGLNHRDFHKDGHGAELVDHVMRALDPKPGSHVFIDPVSPLFITGNPNRSRDVAASLIGFSRIIEERRINISCSVHFAKQKHDITDRYRRPQDRISGSGAFSGFSDTQIYLVDPEPPKQDYHMLGWNPRKSQPEEFKLTRDGQKFIPYIDLEDVGNNLEPDRPDQMADLLGSGGLRYGVFCQRAMAELAISESTFERYFSILRKRNAIERDNEGYWRRRKSPSNLQIVRSDS